MYHTQEARGYHIDGPLKCTKDNAWLGTGFYFWDDIMDAIIWGHKSKRATGNFDIYQADIESERILDTVFNEMHYDSYRRSVEKVAKKIKMKTGRNATIKELNEYLFQKANWRNLVEGVLFQDIPANPKENLVTRYNYRKRIQLVAYTQEIIYNFAHHSDFECNNK